MRFEEEKKLNKKHFYTGVFTALCIVYGKMCLVFIFCMLMYMLGLGLEAGMAVLLKDATFKKCNSQKEGGGGGRERDQQCTLLVKLTPDKYPSFHD